MENIIVKVEPPDFMGEETFDNLPCSSTSYSADEETISDSNNILQENEIKEESCENSQDMKYDHLAEYCFESDHPALRHNSDYKELLKALTVLQAQRSRAITDLDRLYELKEEALADPIGFVERLQQGEKMDFPAPQNVFPVPVIDWNKYSLSDCSSAFSRRQQTRLSTRAARDLFKSGPYGKSCQSQDQKPSKVNQYWTAEEQKRLEELLVQFPPEEIESRRWEKIANCLENRTPIQVASRVQKYFIKLLKAGMPIPGRMPNMTYLKKPRRNVIRQQPSTFLVSQTPPVYMPEVEEELNYSYCQPQTSEENSMESRFDASDDEDFSPDIRQTAEYQELALLKRILKEKQPNCDSTLHAGFKCCHCKTEPIVGVRWHCTECKPPMSIDFCEDCVNSMHEMGQHTMDHKLEEIHNVRTNFHDQDYTQFLSSYLDPNYMPAT